ncbi:2-methoxy-6-polyprenyl-1,4-benzoquinol methylase, mitochondrial [subsurface metagenome]
MEIFFEIHKDLPREGPGNNESTKKAFEFLKQLPFNSRILDIGCGPGMQTIQLAKITDCKIIALDTHQPFLDGLNQRAKSEGVQDGIETVNNSMFSLDFEDDFFDLIWSEGAIYIFGFEKGLKEWRRFLKKGGYFVISELSWLKQNQPEEVKGFWNKYCPSIKLIEDNIQIIKNLGYDFLHNFTIPESGWWDDYYIPLENRITLLRKKYKGNIEANKVLDQELEEIFLYKKYSEYYGYVFYIIQNK